MTKHSTIPKLATLCILSLGLCSTYVRTRNCSAADGALAAKEKAQSKIDELLSKQPDVPASVVYKKPAVGVERRALEMLSSHPLLSGDRKFAGEEIFLNRVICGPGLWQNIKDDSAMKKLALGNVNFKIPNNNGTQVMNGKLFQTKEEVVAFWKAFVTRYAAAESTIRRPTSEEFRLYWAMIPYDITEPLFVVESNRATILVQFGGEKAGKGADPRNPKIFWIDDYKDLHVNTPSAGQPSK